MEAAQLVAKILDANRKHSSNYTNSFTSAEPKLELAVVTCMDARIDPLKILGLSEGDAHILRNAGGVVSEDTIRSLVISQLLLSTKYIILIHHTNCGMASIDERTAADLIKQQTGLEFPHKIMTFRDPYEDTRASVAMLANNPFILHKNIYGFVYDIDTGLLNAV